MTVPEDDILASYQVVEIASTCAGAFAGRLLAEAGLSVLRLEVEAVPMMVNMPPFAPDGRSIAWLSANAKKAVLRVDAHSQRALIERLIAQSEVFITDAPDWQEARARGVTCHIDPWEGVVAADAGLPSVDVLTQALCGAVSVTGRLTGPPVAIGFPVGDVAPGIYATIAVLNGLLEGTPQQVAIRGLDAAVSLLSYMGCCFKVDGEDIGFIGSGHPYIVPYGAFSASDGYVIVAAFTQVFWRKLCTLLQREDLAATARFRTFSDRRDSREELNKLINDLFSEHTVAYWMEQLRAGDVPHAPVLSVRQAIDQSAVAEREMVIDLDGLRLLNSPVIDMVRRAAGASTRPAVVRDGRAALGRLGLDARTIDGLLRDGVLAAFDGAPAALTSTA